MSDLFVLVEAAPKPGLTASGDFQVAELSSGRRNLDEGSSVQIDTTAPRFTIHHSRIPNHKSAVTGVTPAASRTLKKPSQKRLDVI
jgi:hypothetical protein